MVTGRRGQRALKVTVLLAAMALAIAHFGLRRSSPPAGQSNEPSTTQRKDSALDAAGSLPPKFDEAHLLRGKVEELTRELAEARAEKARASKEKERRCLAAVSDDCPFLDPSEAALAEMARCGIVRMDMPFFPDSDRPAQAETSGEEATIAEVTRSYGERLRAQLRALLRSRPDSGADSEDVSQLIGSLERISRGAAGEPTVLREIARERAGLASPPPLTSQTPAEQFWRLRASIGDAYEDELAKRLGSQRARALRVAHDGWASRSVIVEGGCPEERD